MADFVMKYADGRGQIHQQVATAGSEKELRERYSQQGFLVYSIKPRTASALAATGLFGGHKKLNLEKFLIFNQQFVTLIRAGLPILKGLDLLAERLTDPKLGPYIKAVRDEVRNGTLLSEAFRQQGIFPKIYVTSVMAGEKSGSLTEVLDRYINYQKMSLAVKKKVVVSLMYPCVLIVLVVLLMVFLVTYVVPTFATLYNSMQAKLPTMTVVLIAIGTTARAYILIFAGALVGAIFLFRWWARKDSARQHVDRMKMKRPHHSGRGVLEQLRAHQFALPDRQCPGHPAFWSAADQRPESIRKQGRLAAPVTAVPGQRPRALSVGGRELRAVCPGGRRQNGGLALAAGQRAGDRAGWRRHNRRVLSAGLHHL
jgi:type II secretory pathway component PulF